VTKIRVSQYTLQALKAAVDFLTSYISLPSWQDQIPPQNWASSFKIETTYSTDIVTARENQTEERRALWGRPSRTIEVLWTAIPLERLEKMLHIMRYMNEDRFIVPIYCDTTTILADYDAGGSTPLNLTISIENRRFFKNAYVAAEKDGDVAFRRLTGFTSTGIQIDSALPWSGSAGQIYVFPCITAEQLLKGQVNLQTDQVGNLSLSIKEAISKYALPPSWTGLPPGWDIFEDLPIVDPLYLHNWSEALPIMDQRAGIQQAFGRGVYSETWGAAPRRTTSIVCLQDRADAYKFLQLFDSRRGRLLPLWVIDAQGGWSVKAIGTGYIEVKSRGDVSYLSEVGYIGLTDKNGNSEIQKVVSVSEVNGNWKFLLTGTFSMAASDVIHCARARKSRFATDALQQEFKTSNVVLTAASFIELISEVN
jgi:hypothetical protein